MTFALVASIIAATMSFVAIIFILGLMGLFMQSTQQLQVVASDIADMKEIFSNEMNEHSSEMDQESHIDKHEIEMLRQVFIKIIEEE